MSRQCSAVPSAPTSYWCARGERGRRKRAFPAPMYKESPGMVLMSSVDTSRGKPSYKGSGGVRPRRKPTPHMADSRR